MRNTLCRVHSNHRKAFYADFTAAYWAPTKNEALRALGRLEASWGKALSQGPPRSPCSNAEAFLALHGRASKPLDFTTKHEISSNGLTENSKGVSIRPEQCKARMNLEACMGPSPPNRKNGGPKGSIVHVKELKRAA